MDNFFWGKQKGASLSKGWLLQAALFFVFIGLFAKPVWSLQVLQRVYASPPRSTQLPAIDSIETWCKELSKSLRSVDFQRCKERKWTILGRSTSGLIIPKLEWGAEKGRHVLILGGIHGDEISSVSLVFRWLDFLEKVRVDSPLREMHFLFLPLANPDGFFINPRTRTNINGVDLNRNFNSIGWEKEALSYWKSKTKQDKRRYPGATPSSEVETKLLEKELASYVPEIVISVHAPYGILDHDGPIQLPKHLHSPLPVKTLGAFPGSMGRYVGIDRKIPVITVELLTAKTLPDAKAIEELLIYVMNTKGVQSIAR